MFYYHNMVNISAFSSIEYLCIIDVFFPAKSGENII